MNWFERLARQERKHRRRVRASNVRAYRQRQAASGYKRIDLALTIGQYNFVEQSALEGESISRTIGRLLGAITGNTNSPTKIE
jgi:hypothetical protein